VVYSYVDEHGRIRMVDSPEKVPEAHRDRVVVTDTSTSRTERVRASRALVLDLRQEKEGQPLNYSVVDLQALHTGRDQPAQAPPEDAGALGRWVVGKAARRIHQALGLSPAGAPARVILYTAPWCGFCKKAADHLRSRGVAFEERDVDRDRSAALELSRKLRQAGLGSSGVPVLDINGTIVIGFKKSEIDALLDAGGTAR
jgi:glutaredoxin